MLIKPSEPDSKNYIKHLLLVLNMNLNEVMSRIKKNKGKEMPSKQGIYVIFAKNPFNLVFTDVCKDQIVYVGESKNLNNRQVKNHFRNGRTGSSTLRRSLGAIFRESFNLKCYLRGKKIDKSKGYRFDDKGESRLTKWMIKNLSESFCVTSNSKKTRETIEKKVIACLPKKPILNLKKIKHEHIKQIREMRKVCREEAKRNGLKVEHVKEK